MQGCCRSGQIDNRLLGAKRRCRRWQMLGCCRCRLAMLGMSAGLQTDSITVAAGARWATTMANDGQAAIRLGGAGAGASGYRLALGKRQSATERHALENGRRQGRTAGGAGRCNVGRAWQGLQMRFESKAATNAGNALYCRRCMSPGWQLQQIRYGRWQRASKGRAQ